MVLLPLVSAWTLSTTGLLLWLSLLVAGYVIRSWFHLIQSLCKRPLEYLLRDPTVLRHNHNDPSTTSPASPYHKSVCIYLDDVLVHGRTFGEVLGRLREVLTRLRDAGLTLAMNKCEFFPKQLLYLGFVLEDGQLRPNPKRVEALHRLKTPTCVREVRSFLGCVGYFRPFIQAYAGIAEPLTRLLKKNQRFVWGAEQEHASAELIKALADVTLTNPLEGSLLKLDTDASDLAIGSVLFCRMTDKDPWRPVEFLSKMLNEQQRRWPVHEREAYAIVYSLEKFDAYMELGGKGRKVGRKCGGGWLWELFVRISFRSLLTMLQRNVSKTKLPYGRLQHGFLA